MWQMTVLIKTTIAVFFVPNLTDIVCRVNFWALHILPAANSLQNRNIEKYTIVQHSLTFGRLLKSAKPVILRRVATSSRIKVVSWLQESCWVICRRLMWSHEADVSVLFSNDFMSPSPSGLCVMSAKLQTGSDSQCTTLLILNFYAIRQCLPSSLIQDEISADFHIGLGSHLASIMQKRLGDAKIQEVT